MTTETRLRWERTEEPPDGYTFGHTDFDTETGKLWALWANPAWPESTAHVWIEMRKVTQSRTVTGWEDVT